MTASGSDCNDEQNIIKKSIYPNKNSIFIVGSSQVARLNYLLINEQVSSIHPDYHVYNLALGSDVPVYSLLENYASMKLWDDTYHVTKSKEGIIYSKDVAKIILNELIEE